MATRYVHLYEIFPNNVAKGGAGETGYNEAVSALASILTLLHLWPVYLNWPEQEQPFYAPKHFTIAMHCPRFQPVVSHVHCFQGLKFIPSTENAYLATMSNIDM